MAYIPLQNTDHYCQWITSAGESRTGKPVMLFIHGWGGSARYWQATATALSDQFDCLLYD
ncbi:MAG: alpha/beta hydrolase, partial [Synechococcales cyanobacterium RM1_1_8]|nr:alpha/beta hydrolase [Synechococcales cyanobacterium RM1_1_8]